MGASIKEWYMYILGALIVICATFFASSLMWTIIPVGSHDIIVLAVGFLFGQAGQVVGYFYGSSKSSADKTDAMNSVVDTLTKKAE